MNIIYPVYFTRGGRGINWRTQRNRITVDLNYYPNHVINTSILDTCHLSGQFTINPISSGYFLQNGQMVRVTNLAGYDGNNILKYCPACGNIKTIQEFDYSGRFTGEQRDQSNCMECRQAY